MADPETVQDDEGRDRYARRWLGYAAGKTWRLVRSHLISAGVSLVGAAVALYLLAPAVLGPDSGLLPEAELAIAALLAIGSVLVVLFGFFAWAFFSAPAALERQARASARERELTAKRERDRAQEALSDLRDSLDRSRLRVDVRNASDQLTPVASSNAAMTAFINAEDDALTEGFEADQARSRAIGSILGDRWDDGIGDSRSRDEYIKEVRDYLRAMSETWPRPVAAEAVDQAIAVLRLIVHNIGEVGYAGVEVELSLPPEWDAAWEEGNLWEEDLPDRPVVWGAYNALSYFPDIERSVVPVPQETPGEIRDGDERIIVRWRPFGLPSSRDHALAPVRIFVPDSYAGQTASLRWTAASVGSGRPIEGTVVVNLSATPVEPAELLLPRD